MEIEGEKYANRKMLPTDRIKNSML